MMVYIAGDSSMRPIWLRGDITDVNWNLHCETCKCTQAGKKNCITLTTTTTVLFN